MLSRAWPEVEPDAKAELAAVQSELKTPRNRPEGGAGSTRRADARDQGLAVNVVAPAHKAMASERDIDDARDLADLLNKIA